MFRQVVFFNKGATTWGSSAVGSLWFFGLALVFLGLLILFFPRILVAMVATLFILAGAVLMAISWREWQLRRGYHRVRREVQ